jgi:energy-coupling factor transporter ATP-binding protein EcfA2
LRPYEYDDHPSFFGREDQTYGLYRLLDRSKFVAVVGSSGSGKSSLVNAGLLPLLQQETEGSGGRAWRWTKMRPGGAPLAALADAVMEFAPQVEQGAMAEALRDKVAFALRGSSFGIADGLAAMEGLGNASVLLVVDQFEELFRYANLTGGGARDRGEDSPGRAEAAHFVQLLLEAGRDKTRAVHVLITMRSDFIGECARFQGLPEAVSGTQFLVPSLRRDQLKEVIRKPVEKVGGALQPELVERLLNDCSTDLDQLPVLQHCLMRLWEHAGRGDIPVRVSTRYGR